MRIITIKCNCSINGVPRLVTSPIKVNHFALSTHHFNVTDKCLKTSRLMEHTLNVALVAVIQAMVANLVLVKWHLMPLCPDEGNYVVDQHVLDVC